MRLPTLRCAIPLNEKAGLMKKERERGLCGTDVGRQSLTGPPRIRDPLRPETPGSACPAAGRGSAQLQSRVRGTEVRIPLEHFRGAVAGDRHDLHGVKTPLEQARRRLMAQVVKMQVLDPRGPAGLAPLVFQAVLCDREHDAADRGRHVLQDAERARGQRDRAPAIDLRIRQVGHASADIAARKTQNLALPHGRFDRPHSHRPQPAIARGGAGLKRRSSLPGSRRRSRAGRPRGILTPRTGLRSPSMPHSVAASW